MDIVLFMTDAPIKQHYVPRMYLKNFSIDGRFISQYILDNKQFCIQVPIKSVAYREYIYGKDPSLELKLSKHESESDIVLRKIFRENDISSLTSEELDIMLKFLSILYGRTAGIADAGKQIFHQMDKHIADECGEGLFQYFGEPSDAFEKYIIPASIETGERNYPMLRRLKTTLMVNRSNTSFITSDMPVALYDQMIVYSPYHQNYGLGSKGVQIFCPISEKLCIFLYDSSAYQCDSIKGSRYEIKSEYLVNEINKLEILNAHNFIYFNRNNTDEKSINRLLRFRKYGKYPRGDVLMKPYYDSRGDILYSLSRGSIVEKINLPFSKCMCKNDGQYKTYDQSISELE